MKERIYIIYDETYITEQDDATVFEICNSLKEAKESLKEYWQNNGVIVEALTVDGEIIKEEIIK